MTSPSLRPARVFWAKQRILFGRQSRRSPERVSTILRRQDSRSTPIVGREVLILSSSVLQTHINRKSPDFEKNIRRMVDLLTEIKNEEEQIRQGGGAKAIEAQHKKGRRTARERIAQLIDPGSAFFELGIYTAYEMYEEWGGAPAAGAITGLARVAGRTVMIIANDARVQAAIGQKVSAEELGGAKMHARISGTVDFRESDDDACIRRIRELVDMMGHRPRAPFDHKDSQPPAYPPEEIYGVFSADPVKQYDMREVIARIVDGSRFEEYRSEYGETLLCGYARIGGWAVGLVANQKKNVQTIAPGTGERRIEFGGVIYTESAEKAARFILDCNQNLVPLVFLHDVNGFMVGKEAEWSGIIRAGAKMVNAVSNSLVPKIAVICGGSFGAGHYAMCGKAYDPRFIFAWPTARYAVMSGDSAASTLVEIKIKQLEREGKKLSEKERKELLESIRSTYEHQTDPRYAAARLWVDAIIDPAQTREALIWALEAASLNPVVREFKTGVLQT